MRPQAPPELLERSGHWAELTRWERAEVGRALRRLGWTYGEIRQVIPVPKGTLSYWCREIRLSEEQVEAIKARSGSPKGVPRDTQRKRRNEVRRIQAKARSFARRRLDDPFFVAGTALYWGEGDKSQTRLGVANTDPAILRVFIAWVRRYHDPAAEFVLSLHLHEGNDEAEAKRYWAEVLDLPSAVFWKTFVKPKGTGHRKNHLVQGICRVQARRSTDHAYRTMAWIEVLSEAFGGEYVSVEGC